jgi:hypothetical protein
VRSRSDGAEVSDGEERARSDWGEVNDRRGTEAVFEGLGVDRLGASAEMKLRVHVGAGVRVEVPGRGVPAVADHGEFGFHRDAALAGGKRQREVNDTGQGHGAGDWAAKESPVRD